MSAHRRIQNKRPAPSADTIKIPMVEDFVECAIDGCGFKAPRVDGHLKKAHSLKAGDSQYERLKEK